MMNLWSCWILFAFLANSCSSRHLQRRDINWNGNNWATSCDFNGNDLSNVQTSADQCGPKCSTTPACTHFTWTQYNGGTCWMKQGQISKSDAIQTNDPTMVCGVVDKQDPG